MQTHAESKHGVRAISGNNARTLISANVAAILMQKNMSRCIYMTCGSFNGIVEKAGGIFPHLHTTHSITA